MTAVPRRSRGGRGGALAGRGGPLLALATVVVGVTGATPVAAAAVPEDPPAYRWQLPAGFPEPPVPADNPMSEAKVELGRRLFYDPLLSGNRSASCASCHQQERAFSDGRAVAVGATGELHRRNAMALVNVAYNPAFNWADPDVTLLEEQLLEPIFGRHPLELGLDDEAQLVARLAAHSDYPRRFVEAFPDSAEPLTLDHVAKAIASFERTLISGDSPFDRLLFHGERGALSPLARRGMELFFGARLGCSGCHADFNLSGPVVMAQQPDIVATFHNTGLYDVDGRGSYPSTDRGLVEVTERPEDMGRFRAPTLRNIAVTAPYMHDGSVATLEAVVAHYAGGGRALASRADARLYLGLGRGSPFRSVLVPGFAIAAGEVRDLVHFLLSLTDEGFLDDSRFADPFAP